MNILTVENNSFDLSKMPEFIKDDVRFAIFDYSDPENSDWFFKPLVFIDTFQNHSVILDIMGVKLRLPFEWHIMVSDEDINEIDFIPVTEVNDKENFVLVSNPLGALYHRAVPVRITDIYSEMKWYVPKIPDMAFLSVPIMSGNNPPCVIVSGPKTTIPEHLEFGDFL